MVTLGVVLRYAGFAALCLGIVALIRGLISWAPIANRKVAGIFAGTSLV